MHEGPCQTHKLPRLFQLRHISTKNLCDFRCGKVIEPHWFARLRVTVRWTFLGEGMAFRFLQMRTQGLLLIFAFKDFYSVIYWLYYYCVKNGRFNIVEHSDNGSGGEGEEEATTDFVSRFHIAPILDQDTGEISCEVANRFGRDSKTFLLSIEGST